MPVAKGDPIAHFLSCDKSSYFPELGLHMVNANPFETRGMMGRTLLG